MSDTNETSDQTITAIAAMLEMIPRLVKDGDARAASQLAEGAARLIYGLPGCDTTDDTEDHQFFVWQQNEPNCYRVKFAEADTATDAARSVAENDLSPGESGNFVVARVDGSGIIVVEVHTRMDAAVLRTNVSDTP